MNYQRLLAGGFAGTGAIVLLLQGHTAEGGMILSAMLAFFVGEANGKRIKEVTK